MLRRWRLVLISSWLLLNKKAGVDLQMKTALVLALAGSATAFAPRSVSRPSVAVNGCASSVRTTNRAASPPELPPDARRGAAGPRAARRDRCGAVKKASVAGCRARPAAAPRAAAQDTPRINESFDTRRLALVAVELAANARPLTVFKNAQVRARRPLGLGLGRAPAEGEGGQGPEQGQVPEGRAPGAGPAFRFVLLL